MKKVAFIAIAFSLASFTIFSGKPFKTENYKKNFAKVKNDLLVSKYEATNLEYRTFLSALAAANKLSAYKNNLPDTSVWTRELLLGGPLLPFQEFYFRHPAFNNYPVVGVGYQAANAYCDWLTDEYNNSTDKKYKQVKFRLLTKEEWTFAANKGDTTKAYTWGTGFVFNDKKMPLANFTPSKLVYDSTTKKYIEVADIKIDDNFIQSGINDRQTFTAEVESHYPNIFGLYNMCGNVAEMTAEKGVAKGGGYADLASNVRIASEKMYTGPQADIGFRVAMQIIEE